MTPADTSCDETMTAQELEELLCPTALARESMPGAPTRPRPPIEYLAMIAARLQHSPHLVGFPAYRVWSLVARSQTFPLPNIVQEAASTDTAPDIAALSRRLRRIAAIRNAGIKGERLAAPQPFVEEQEYEEEQISYDPLEALRTSAT